MESTPEENAALVRPFLTDVVAGEDTDALGIFLTDNAVNYQPVVDERLAGNTVYHAWYALAAADIDIAIDAIVAANDQVAVRGTITGTHRESLLDLVPTGRSFEIACAWFCRVRDGRIREIWSLPDGFGFLRQLDGTSEDRLPRLSSHPNEQ